MFPVLFKSNGKNKDFEYDYRQIYRYLNLVKYQRKFLLQIKHSQVVTTFKLYTE